jgi:hypothetical protein
MGAWSLQISRGVASIVIDVQLKGHDSNLRVRELCLNLQSCETDLAHCEGLQIAPPVIVACLILLSFRFSLESSARPSRQCDSFVTTGFRTLFGKHLLIFSLKSVVPAFIAPITAMCTTEDRQIASVKGTVSPGKGLTSHPLCIM